MKNLRTNRSMTKTITRIAYCLIAVVAVGIAIHLLRSGPHAMAASNQRDSKLVSIEPIHESANDASGEMCEVVPANASTSLRSALAEEAAATTAGLSDKKKEELRTRKQLRMVKDNYSSFSSVAVDPVRNEVVMTDESLFQILVYDRMTNTPPGSNFSEPKRMIGGLDTKADYVCGLYIDPPTGDIYALNNDTVDTMIIFDRQAKGNVKPTRELFTPHGTYGITVDEDAKEMFFTVQHDSAIVVFDKYATKDDPPHRFIQGDKTRLADPHGIALDTQRGLLYVANFGSVHSHEEGKDNKGRPMYSRGKGKPNWPLTRNSAIPGSGRFYPPSVTVYRKTDKGDVTPLRKIEGPKAGFDWPTGIAIDPVKNELYVTNDMTDEVRIFDAEANGDVAPKRIIKGSNTLIKNPTGIWIDQQNQEIWVSNFGNYTTSVFPMDASGNAKPKRSIRSGPANHQALMIGNPHPVAYDSKREQILVPN